MPQKLWPIVALATVLAVGASPASAASIYRGCDGPQWGTYPCWDPANPADVAAMHPCPSWTNRHTRAFDADAGSYQGFVKIRSTVSCKLAYELMNDRTEGGAAFYPADGWYWYPGYGNVGGVWHRGPEQLIRGLHIARTNEPTGPASLNWNPHSTMLEHDLVTYDEEELVDCSTVPNNADVHCVNVTPASYAGVRL